MRMRLLPIIAFALYDCYFLVIASIRFGVRLLITIRSVIDGKIALLTAEQVMGILDLFLCF